jgi:hypothetical protein
MYRVQRRLSRGTSTCANSHVNPTANSIRHLVAALEVQQAAAAEKHEALWRRAKRILAEMEDRERRLQAFREKFDGGRAA